MISKMFKLVPALIFIFGSGLVVVNCKTAAFKELKPVLIKSVISHPKLPFNHLPSHDDLTSRKIYQFAGPRPNHHHGEREPYQYESPERGQILHRPKSTNSDRNGGSSQQPSSSSSQMPNDAPVIVNGRNGNKKVKYVPTSGYSGSQQQGSNRPPQVYVISGGGDEEEENNPGMMGSMSSYFKSMTGRIRAAMQGLIGGVTD